MAIRAPSPPEEPPGISLRQCGLTVRPNKWLKVSPIYSRVQKRRQFRARAKASQTRARGLESRQIRDRLTMRVCGTFVRQWKTAPESRSRAASALSRSEMRLSSTPALVSKSKIGVREGER